MQSGPRLFTAKAGRLTSLVLLLVLALAACAPGRVPPGPGPGPNHPKLTETAFVTTDGTVLPLRSWQPEGKAQAEPRAVILGLHGFNDYSNAFEEPGLYFSSHGLAVFAYDQRGFGASEHPGLWAGTEVLAEDASTAARLLKARYPDSPLFLLGESMGGAVAIAAMTGPEPPPVDGVILSAPAVWARSTMPFYQRGALWVASRLFPWARFSGSGLDIQPSDNIEMLRALGRDPLVIKNTQVAAIEGLTDLMGTALDKAPDYEVRSLVLYGERDEIVPAEPVQKFWEALPDRDAGKQRLALYEEGYHMLLRDLQAERVMADVMAWVEDPRGKLPSGADHEAHRDLAVLVDGAS